MMKPFGGPDFQRNVKRVGKYEPCGYCGKAIKNKGTAVYVEVLVNGKFEVDAPGSAESQGAFPLGPDCARRFRVERAKKR